MHPIPFNRAAVTGREAEYVTRVIAEGPLHGDGPYTRACHEWLERLTGSPKALLTTSCTHALEMAALLLDLRPGDEVIVPPFTFVSTVNAVVLRGARPVFVDIRPDTLNMDETLIEAAITPKTRAIVPVHLYGQCADMPAIKAIADRHNLRVIEDNAQAIDAAGAGFKIGELSDATSTSFIIQKNLGTFGDGGALLTNDAGIDAQVRKLRNHGSTKRNVHSFGFNSRLDDLHAGVLSAKLKHIHAWNDGRIKWGKRYTAGLSGATRIDLPSVRPGYRHVFHLYVIETKNPGHRDQLVDFLVSNGIDAKTHYSIAIHKQDGYPWGKDARMAGAVPNAERNAASCVSLPMYPELTEAEVDYVIGKVLDWDKAAK